MGEKYISKAMVPAGSGVEIASVSWYGSFRDGKFARGEDYTVTVKVRIKPESSNIFATSGKLNITLNGYKPKLAVAGEHSITVKYTWKQLGGPDVDAPDYKLKTRLAQLAAAYVADNATDDKQVLQYLRSKMPKAEIWCAGGSYKYTRTLPSETKDGRFSMAIGITSEGITIDRYSFTAIIPALSKSPEAEKLNADMALMKAALKEFTVTSKTTGKDVLAAVNAAAINGTKAVWDKNYTYTAPRSNQQGSIDGDIILTLGSKRDIIAAHKVLPVAGKAADTAIDADFSAMFKALNRMELTNKTTEQDLMNVALAAITNGSQLVCTSFSKQKSTYDKEGRIIANFELTLKSARRIPRFSSEIAKKILPLPTDFDINREEWEVLRYTNIERYKQGLSLVVMVNALQSAADIRVKELATDYRHDHLRPDGSKCFTAIDRSFTRGRRLGENAYKSPKTPRQAVNGWMNSSGHRANILNVIFTYIGTGATRTKEESYWIQMFSSGGAVTRAESSTGAYTFKTVEEMEEAYLICYTSEGIKAYIPFEADYMAKNGNDYTINIHGIFWFPIDGILYCLIHLAWYIMYKK